MGKKNDFIIEKIKSSLIRTGGLKNKEKEMINNIIKSHVKESILLATNKQKVCDDLIKKMGSGELDLNIIYPELVKKLKKFN